MSLTSLIKGKTERDLEFQSIVKNVIPKKNQIYTLSEHDAFSSRYETLVPNQLKQNYHSAILGTAFDYLARLIIAQHVSLTHEEVWTDTTSNKGLYMLIKMTSGKVGQALILKYNQGLKIAENFVKNSSDVTMNLLIHSTLMARLEHIMRSGRLPMSIEDSLLSEEDDQLLFELKGICDVFIDRFILPDIMTRTSDVVFNPHFESGSIACGGAEADVFIDGVLYDFKTTKQTGYKWQDMPQVLSYYVLHDISKRQNDESAVLYDRDMTKLAFYKARYGEVEQIDINTIDSKKMNNAVQKIIDVLNLSQINGQYPPVILCVFVFNFKLCIMSNFIYSSSFKLSIYVVKHLTKDIF